MRHAWYVEALVGGLVLAVGLCGIALPLAGHLRRQRSTVDALRVAIVNAQHIGDQLAGQERRLAELRERDRTLQQRIDNGQSVARILDTVKLQAANHELELTALQSKAQADTTHLLSVGADRSLREVPLTLQVTGRYRQLGEFLGEFSSNPFLAFVRQISITKSDPAGVSLRADLELTLYVLEPPAAGRSSAAIAPPGRTSY